MQHLWEYHDWLVVHRVFAALPASSKCGGPLHTGAGAAALAIARSVAGLTRTNR